MAAPSFAARRPRGTNDIVGAEAFAHAHLLRLAQEIFSAYGYAPITTPIFEQTDLFVRGIGESTDVVSKEMFSVLSPDAHAKICTGTPLKKDQRLTLRPEGTASALRAAFENGMVMQGGSPVKLWYAGPMFRAERPQKGRYRQFHQIGAECLGAPSPLADAEMITMLMRYFEACGIERSSIRLLINSMGDDKCRPAYRESVRDYILDHRTDLCEECVRRADINPLRAFDCKNPHCQEVMSGAPIITDALSSDCAHHYEQVKHYLEMAGITYEEDPRLVRGLDYYTRTVFEVQVVDGLGAQNAIGGGGRYDKLAELMGAPDTCGLGFAVGVERMLIALEHQGVSVGESARLNYYVAGVDSKSNPQTQDAVYQTACTLRDQGLSVDFDLQGKSLKAQMKQAGKLNAQAVIIVGPEELERGEAVVRNMDTRDERTVTLDALRQGELR